MASAYLDTPAPNALNPAPLCTTSEKRYQHFKKIMIFKMKSGSEIGYETDVRLKYNSTFICYIKPHYIQINIDNENMIS